MIWLALWLLSGFALNFAYLFIHAIRRLWPHHSRGIPARELIAAAFDCAKPEGVGVAFGASLAGPFGWLIIRRTLKP